MEATFVLNEQEDRQQFAKRLTEFYAGKTIRVRVEEVPLQSGQQHLLKRMEALRLLTERVPVALPPGIDINDLIDEVNDNSL